MSVYQARPNGPDAFARMIEEAIEAEDSADRHGRGPRKLLAIGEVVDGIVFPFAQPLVVDMPSAPLAPEKDPAPPIDLIEVHGVWMTREDAIAQAHAAVAAAPFNRRA